jgi:hypothetical protein
VAVTRCRIQLLRETPGWPGALGSTTADPDASFDAVAGLYSRNHRMHTDLNSRLELNSFVSTSSLGHL